MLQSWRPRERNIVFEPRPEGIPEHLYNTAMAAKRFYNQNWDYWVWLEHRDREAELGRSVPLSEVEDACIRGMRKEINRIKFVHGDGVGEWFERFLDMGDIFNKVNHPDYIKKLGYSNK